MRRPALATYSGACSSVSGSQRACGHACRLPCDAGSLCPPCDFLCIHGCDHAACARPCGESCVLCLRPCSWERPHPAGRPRPAPVGVVGPAAGCCAMWCDAPCDLPECDRLCEQPLVWGDSCLYLWEEPWSRACRRVTAPSVAVRIQNW